MLALSVLGLASCASSQAADSPIIWDPPEWSGLVVIYADQAKNCSAQVPIGEPHQSGTVVADGYAHLALSGEDQSGPDLVFHTPTMNGDHVSIALNDKGAGTGVFGHGFYAGQKLVLTGLGGRLLRAGSRAAANPSAWYPIQFLAEMQDPAGNCLYRIRLSGSQHGRQRS